MAPTEKVRPFKDTRKYYFRVHNYVFDICMPKLSNAGWRVLCVAMRKTWGWVAEDAESPLDRKEWDQISYSQFIEASGLKSPSSISKGIRENLTARYLIRRQVGTYQGTKKPIYAYALNQDFEDDWNPGSTTTSVSDEIDPNISTTESVAEPTTQTGLAATTESVDTKGNKREKGKEKEDPFSDLWPLALADLQLQLDPSTFDKLLLGSTATATSDNGALRLTVHPRNPRSVEMLDARLRPVVERTLARVAGGPVAVQFIARNDKDA